MVVESKGACNGSGPDYNRDHLDDNCNKEVEGNRSDVHAHKVAYNLDLGEEQRVDAAGEDTFSGYNTCATNEKAADPCINDEHEDGSWKDDEDRRRAYRMEVDVEAYALDPSRFIVTSFNMVFLKCFHENVVDRKWFPKNSSPQIILSLNLTFIG